MNDVGWLLFAQAYCGDADRSSNSKQKGEMWGRMAVPQGEGERGRREKGEKDYTVPHS